MAILRGWLRLAVAAEVDVGGDMPDEDALVEVGSLTLQLISSYNLRLPLAPGG